LPVFARLRVSAVQTVYESLRLAQLSTQFGLLTVNVCDPASGSALVSSLHDLQLAAHLLDLHVQFLQQCLRLEGLRVIGHVGIVSSNSNDCSPTCDLVTSA